MVEIVFVLVAGAVGTALFGRWHEEDRQRALIARSFLGMVRQGAAERRKGYQAQLQFMADFIKEPKYGALCYQAGWWIGVVMVFVGVFLRSWPLAALSPLGFFVPYFWLDNKVKKMYRTLEKQSREYRLLVAFLIRSGASIPAAIAAATDLLQPPLRPYMDRVVKQVGWGKGIQSLSVKEAFALLKKDLPIPSIIRMAQTFELNDRIQADNQEEQLMRSLRLEEQGRNNLAYKQLGKLQVKIDLVSTLGLEMLVEMYLLWVGFQSIGAVLGTIRF